MKITKVEFIKSVAHFAGMPSQNYPTIAFAGRSNVGKSSLINTLLNRKKLAKTSSTPGKTRFINYFAINDKLFFADLPGYGFAKVPKAMRMQWDTLTEPFLLRNENLKLVLLLVDPRHEIKETDVQLLEFLEHNDVTTQIVLTKSDKISNNEGVKRVRELVNEFALDNPPILFSSLKKKGISLVWQSISKEVSK